MKTFSVLVLLTALQIAEAQTISSPDYFVESVTTGLNLPTTLAFVNMNTILVCEKASGKLKKLANGVYSGDAIDLAVANDGERGLLGIALHPGFQTNGFVYLYYSHATADGGAWLDDRVERFTWNGTSLTFESTIIVFPMDTTQNNTPFHHGGFMRIGPDQKLYFMVGDMGRGPFGNGRIEQNTSATAVAGTGAIYRLNLDGSIPSDNPFVTHADDRIKKIYVYGFRNAFGMMFDPLTNRLWFSENGPEVYDELNIAVSGMNSGWVLIMGPDYRNASYGNNNFGMYNASDLVMLPGSTYRDPIFSWLTPIGVTSVYFMANDKWSASERNNILVGDVNRGDIYRFQVNMARDGLILTPDTQDLVADNEQERAEFTFGSNWGIVTDMETGPDGYLYVLSYNTGNINRIRPVQEKVVPAGFSLSRGIQLSGNLQSLYESDDDRLVLRPGVVLSSTEAPIQLNLNATSPFSSPSALRFTLEAHSNSANIQQKLSLYNWTTNQYEDLDTRLATLSDSTVQISVTTNPARFVQAATNALRTKISYKQTAPIISYPWQARIDVAAWTAVR